MIAILPILKEISDSLKQLVKERQNDAKKNSSLDKIAEAIKNQTSQEISVTTQGSSSTVTGLSGLTDCIDSLTDKLEEVKTVLVGIKEAEDGTTAAGVSSRLTYIATMMEQNNNKLVTAINRKVVFPEASMIVEGTADPVTMIFTEDTGQPSLADAADAYMQGKLLFIQYVVGNTEYIDMITVANLTTPEFQSQGGYIWS